MNTSVPSSTNGKAQKRVLLGAIEPVHLVQEQHRVAPVQPVVARAVRARSTTSRMSLTPANTADSAWNSAAQDLATRRASVVLPVPGGPHSSIECSVAPPTSRVSGLPGPSSCD